MIEHVCVIGLGLMGGSFAKAVVENRLCNRLTAFDNNAQTLALAERCGLIDTVFKQASEAVKNADIIVIATPMRYLEAVFTDIAPQIKPSAIITDLGSSKVYAIKAAEKTLGEHLHHYVPGHPITGSNQHGFSAANSQLFHKRPVLLTPLMNTNKEAIACVSTLWQNLGATTHILEADQHDEILALTSHLPHLLSSSYLLEIANHKTDSIKQAIGGGFKDFTRLGQSLSSLWQDIFLSNKENLIAEIQKFQNNLSKLQTAIENEDGELLKSLLEKASQARASLKDYLP